MTWRVRTTFDDQPGRLAALATACGQAGLNIVSMQVIGPEVGSGRAQVTDEFVVEATDGAPDLDDVAVAELFVHAGGRDVAVTRTDREVEDAPTRYLRGVRAVLEDGRDVESVLRELLDTAPPDVVDYAGHDVLDLADARGRPLRISRAVPFTPAERARAQALVALVGEAASTHQDPLWGPRWEPLHPEPLVRAATAADAEALGRLHDRCSPETLYARYLVPLPLPLAPRLLRRLALPDHGVALVTQVGLDVVGHALIEHDDGLANCRLLVEDAWQRRGIGTRLVRAATQRAAESGDSVLVFLTAGHDDVVLRAVGAAGLTARVERHGDLVRVSVSLSPPP